MKKITLGLLTADRPEYTKRTLASFAAHNDLSRFELLHHDDGEDGAENLGIAEHYGFHSVSTLMRVGQIESLRSLLDRASCEFYLHLENDWLTTAPFPWHLVGAGWECLRLYGAMKAASGPRAMAGTHVMGTKLLIDWRPMTMSSDCEHAIAHWAGPPSVCRTADLRRVAKDAASFKDISLRFRPYTWRLREAIVQHIGDEQTPGFKP